MAVVFTADRIDDYYLHTFGETSDTNYYDADFTDPPIPRGSANNLRITAGMFRVPDPGTDDLWLHVRAQYRTGSNCSVAGSTSAQAMITFETADGVMLADLFAIRISGGTSGGLGIRAFGDTTAQTPNIECFAFSNPSNTTVIETYDIRVAVDSSTIEVDLYVNGTLIDTLSVANTTGLKDPVGQIRMCPGAHYDTYSVGSSYTEVIATISESTVGWRLATTNFVGDGTYGQWIGSYEDVRYAQDGRSVAAAETGIRETWEATDYAGPPGYTVRCVAMSITAHAGEAGGPQTVQPCVVVGGVAYDMDPIALGYIPDRYFVTWDENPATAAPWDLAELVDWEFGVRSAT